MDETGLSIDQSSKRNSHTRFISMGEKGKPGMGAIYQSGKGEAGIVAFYQSGVGEPGIVAFYQSGNGATVHSRILSIGKQGNLP